MDTVSGTLVQLDVIHCSLFVVKFVSRYPGVLQCHDSAATYRQVKKRNLIDL